MLHQDTRLLEPLRPRQQLMLYLCWKHYIKTVVSLNTQKLFQCDKQSEFKSDVTKLFQKHNVNVNRTTTKYKCTHIVFVEVFNKESTK